jgi:riboflavin synthase
MFSGIIEETGRVVGVKLTGPGFRLLIESCLDHSHTKIGDSIAIEGVCLTVTGIKDSALEFDLSAESARRSTLQSLKPGQSVNLERSLMLGDRVHGHLVAGHVDCTTELLSSEAEGESYKLTWDLPREFQGYIAPKGSVALGGVSLTVGEVSATMFTTYIIPYTLKVTTLGALCPGQRVNLEVDLLARYVRSQLTAIQPSNDKNLLKSLSEAGFIKE